MLCGENCIAGCVTTLLSPSRQIGHDHFLLEPFQFDTHLSCYQLQLYNLATDSIVKLPPEEEYICQLCPLCFYCTFHVIKNLHLPCFHCSLCQCMAAVACIARSLTSVKLYVIKLVLVLNQRVTLWPLYGQVAQ
jgi:hypothetical protein